MPVHVCALGVCYTVILYKCNYSDENTDHEKDTYLYTVKTRSIAVFDP